MTKGLKTLETLTDTAIDSVKGYETASEVAKTSGLKQVLRDQATKRRRVVDSLNAEIVRLGGKPRESGSTAGAAHRIWTSISDAFSSGDKKAAERVEEGEDYIEKKFREALDSKDFDPQTEQLVARAHADIAQDERLADRLEKQYD